MVLLWASCYRGLTLAVKFDFGGVALVVLLAGVSYLCLLVLLRWMVTVVSR